MLGRFLESRRENRGIKTGRKAAEEGSQPHVSNPAVRSRRGAPRTLVAPIDRLLPDELLSYIFVCGMEDEILEEANEPFDRTINRGRPVFTALISSVSHRWRAVAYATPELWSVISIPCGTDDPYFRRLRAHVQSCLRLAGTVGLRVRFLARSDGSPNLASSGDMEVLTGLNSYHFGRCRELRMPVTDASQLRTVLESLAGSHLDLLDLDCGPELHHSPQSLEQYLTACTELRSLRVNNIAFPTGLWKVPWLKTLELEGVSLDFVFSRELFELLKALSMLEHLRLNARSRFDMFTHDLPTVTTFTMPYLTTLSLFVVPEIFVTNLLATVQTPALKYLALCQIYPNRPFNRHRIARSFLEIIRGWNVDCSRLTSLELDEREITPLGHMAYDDIRILLNCLPSLKILRLGFAQELSQWLAVLSDNAASPVEPPMIPSLRKMSIYGALRDYRFSQVLRVMAARAACPGITGLQHLEAWVCAPYGSQKDLETLFEAVPFPTIRVVDERRDFTPREEGVFRARLQMDSSRYRRDVIGDGHLAIVRTITFVDKFISLGAR